MCKQAHGGTPRPRRRRRKQPCQPPAVHGLRISVHGDVHVTDTPTQSQPEHGVDYRRTDSHHVIHTCFVIASHPHGDRPTATARCVTERPWWSLGTLFTRADTFFCSSLSSQPRTLHQHCCQRRCDGFDAYRYVKMNPQEIDPGMGAQLKQLDHRRGGGVDLLPSQCATPYRAPELGGDAGDMLKILGPPS